MKSLHVGGLYCHPGASAESVGTLIFGALESRARGSTDGREDAQRTTASPEHPGLVSLETSVTGPGEADHSGEGRERVRVFRHDGRLRRMRRSVRSSAQLLQDESVQQGRRCKAAMVTLTYAPEIHWEPRQVTGFVRSVREYLRRRGFSCRFVWVLELTKAGRPHYHVLFWLPLGVTLPKPDKRGWWPYGSTRIEWARSPVGYLIKYASKGIDGDELPKGARLSASGGLSKSARMVRSWQLCPAWVRELFTVEDRPVRVPGGGWISRLTGVFEPARWRLVDKAPDWSWLIFAPVGVVS